MSSVKTVSTEDIFNILAPDVRASLSARAQAGHLLFVDGITDPVERGLAVHLIGKIDKALSKRMKVIGGKWGGNPVAQDNARSRTMKAWYIAARAMIHGPAFKLAEKPNARDIVRLAKAGNALVKIIAEVDNAQYGDIPELKGHHDVTHEQYQRGILLGLAGFCGKVERMQSLMAEASSIVSN
jgi:hypothetical protein